MKKLHSFAVYALAAPALALGSSAVLADGPASGEMDREQSSAQYDGDTKRSTPLSAQSGESTSKRSGMENVGYMSAAPANGLHAGDLIGADVTTTGDERVGPVNDLIIDENGQIVGLVVGVGGFLGLGEKVVGIGWDDVTISGASDDVELRINQTREELGSAPNFERQD